jgi:hypothetical protein
VVIFVLTVVIAAVLLSLLTWLNGGHNPAYGLS